MTKMLLFWKLDLSILQKIQTVCKNMHATLEPIFGYHDSEILQTRLKDLANIEHLVSGLKPGLVSGKDGTLLKVRP